MKTSRSAITCYQSCPRKRYWQFHHADTGIEPRKQAVPLVWGTALHVGVASLLLRKEADLAVSEALSAYAQQCTERDFDIDELESQSFVYHEGKALIEGFIRAWASARMPDFLGTYEVLEVEQEGLWSGWTEDVDLAYRPDALLRKRNTGGLYVFNLKSSYAWGDRELKASRYNVQGLSEMAALEHRLAEWKFVFMQDPEIVVKVLPQWFTEMLDRDPDASLKISGIQDEIFIKGSRLERKKGANEKWQMTFLVHPWLKSGITTDDDEWAWQYYFDRNGRTTSLGSSYSRVSVWEHMPMKEWVEMLSDGAVQDSFPLSELFATPIPHERNATELDEWLRQAQAQEQLVMLNLDYLASAPDLEEKGRRLDQLFPMYRHSCFSYQKTCSYAAICHDRLSPDCGLYVPREDHHKIPDE